MIRRMVVTQRPQRGLQPRQPYTWPAVRGAASPETAVRTAWSLSTLQEQMIMGIARGIRTKPTGSIRQRRSKSKGKNAVYSASNLAVNAACTRQHVTVLMCCADIDIEPRGQGNAIVLRRTDARPCRTL